jgi:hypothetical protein
VREKQRTAQRKEQRKKERKEGGETIIKQESKEGRNTKGK